MLNRVDLILGDSTVEIDKLEDNSVDVLVSDIPYGVSINKFWDKNIPNALFWNKCYSKLKPGAHCILFGQPSMIVELATIMSATAFEYRDMWIWQYQGTHTKGYKTEDGSFRSRIRNVFNPIFVYRKRLEGTEQENWEKYGTNLFNIDDNREPYKGNHKNIIKKFKETGEKHFQSSVPSNTYKDLKAKGWVPDPRGAEPTNIKYIPRATTFEKTAGGLVKNTHETVKPVALMSWLVGLTTHNKDQVVLDPFMGTGSTGCACTKLNRKFIGIELDEESFNIARIRIDKEFQDGKEKE